MEFDASGELNAETRLWRYMDVGRFLALLKFKSLYFARPHEFSDPWEAHQLQSIRQQSLEYARIMNERLRSRDQQWHHHKTVRDDPETQAKMSAEVWDAVTRLALVNCWHENDSESIAMWKLYTSGAEGVAIESSVGRLKNALQDATFPYRICPVHYVDYAACNSGFSLSTTGLTNPILSAL